MDALSGQVQPLAGFAEGVDLAPSVSLISCRLRGLGKVLAAATLESFVLQRGLGEI